MGKRLIVRRRAQGLTFTQGQFQREFFLVGHHGAIVGQCVITCLLCSAESVFVGDSADMYYDERQADTWARDHRCVVLP